MRHAPKPTRGQMVRNVGVRMTPAEHAQLVKEFVFERTGETWSQWLRNRMLRNISRSTLIDNGTIASVVATRPVKSGVGRTN